MSTHCINSNSSLRQPGKQRVTGTLAPEQPAETAMTLTLDQLRPNPDNPRMLCNPRYAEIKASIRARGLDTLFKVTADPESDQNQETYILSDGGNTRYQILRELYQETGEERFNRIPCVLKLWPGRLQCLIGHLAENELRGELTFIEKAQGVHQARLLYQQQHQREITLREFSTLLSQQGYPIHYSSISRMEETLQYLYPWMPTLLESGMSRRQIERLLTLRSSAQRLWQRDIQQHIVQERQLVSLCSFEQLFGHCCQRFEALGKWEQASFREQFIADLIQALPHASLSRECCRLELDSRHGNRQQRVMGMAEERLPLFFSKTASSLGCGPISKQNRGADENPLVVPRQLLLDERLSPLDKMGWIMLRLYQQQQQGIIFLRYEELQQLLSLSGKERASKETVSRVLLMLRMTGWISVSQGASDAQEGGRGNGYFQHDQPVTFAQAESLDPDWLQSVLEAGQHGNKTISQTAHSIITAIKQDQTMQHRHSQIARLECRINSAFTAEQRSGNNNVVRNPNPYVRSFTQSVNNNVYVETSTQLTLPERLCQQLMADDISMLNQQLQRLPAEQGKAVLDSLNQALATNKLSNPVGWLLAMMKRAREGKLHIARAKTNAPSPAAVMAKKSGQAGRVTPASAEPREAIVTSSPEHVARIMAEIRQRLKR